MILSSICVEGAQLFIDVIGTWNYENVYGFIVFLFCSRLDYGKYNAKLNFFFGFLSIGKKED